MPLTEKSVVLALVVICGSVQVFAQNTDWTVRYYEGKSGRLVSLQGCRLISVSADTLVVLSQGANHPVRLFLLHELSRPNDDNIIMRPVLIGAVIGGAAGFLASMYVEGAGPDGKTNSRSMATALLATLGAGVGLARGIELEDLRYRFFEVSNPEKKSLIEGIMLEEETRPEESSR